MGDGRLVDDEPGRSVDGASVDDKLAPHDFVADFVWAARAVIAQPGVALVSIALWLLPNFLLITGVKKNPVAMMAGFILAFFALGWLGAERTFFRYRREGKTVRLAELLRRAPSFTGRFLSLGILVGILGGPVIVIATLLIACFHPTATEAFRKVALHVEIVAMTVVADLALTFATSALVFTTRSAREALRIGWAMIRQTWPRSGLYIVCPPLALNLLNAMYPTRLPVVSVVTTAGLAVLALIAKGATAAFYLRERPAGLDAAADVE